MHHRPVYVFDGSYEGLLSVVFASHQRRELPAAVLIEGNEEPSLFSDIVHVETNERHAERVAMALSKKVSARARLRLYRCYLSEQPDVHLCIHEFIRVAMERGRSVETNYTEAYVLALKQWEKKITREVHRMHAFVRFKEVENGVWSALIEPDFDVMPLIGDHFKKRYADQPWLIFDGKRKYGIYFDRQEVRFVKPVSYANDQGVVHLPFTQNETDYQQLWKTYFDHVNIKERENPKLHLQHVPRRYWKNLPEKTLM